MPNRSTDRDRSTRYLEAVLPLNPLLESDRIVRLRAKYLRIEPPRRGDAGREDVWELRQQQAARLDTIRRNFWKSDLNQITRSLKELRLEQFPDLRLARDRLITVAAHRHEFALVAEKGIVDPKFFKSLRTILVAPPRVAATERDDLIESIRNVERLKQIRSMIRTIRKLMPEMYELEADWMETILRMKKPLRRGRRRRGAQL